MSERYRVVYVTSDGSDWAALEFPHGLISPPTLELHRPMIGTVTFYHADSYQLPIPAGAGTTGTMDKRQED